MFLANFIFAVSHLKNNKSYVLILVKKDKMVSCGAPGCTDGADKNSNTITLATII